MNKLFFLPDFHDEEKQRVGQYLNVITLSIVGLLAVLYIYRIFTTAFNLSSTTNIFIAFTVVMMIILRIFLQYGYVRGVSIAFSIITWGALTYQAYSSGGVRDVTVTAYIVVILTASLFLGWKASLPFVGASVIAIWLMANAEATGAHTFTLDTPTNTALYLTIVFFLVFIIIYLLVSGLQRSLQKAKATAQELTFSNNELQALRVDLEQRVAARTKDLKIVAEVGTATATILESKRLLQEVVDLTKERFNLYHSHVYLLDEEGKNLVLTSGAGEPGRVMVAEGRSIPLDREQSLVARAARERKGVTVNDVTQSPDFLANPLLPDTRSELAVPMIVGNRVIGVFDIQSDQVGRFTESDVNIQTTLAAQLATSIQNVRSFEQSRKQAELESLVNTIGQKIQRTTSIEEALQTAIRELGTSIGASRVSANISGQQDGSNNASRN